MRLIGDLFNKEKLSLSIELQAATVKAVLFSIKYKRGRSREVTARGVSEGQLVIPRGTLNPLLSKLNTNSGVSSSDEDLFPASIFKETIKRLIWELMPEKIRRDYDKISFSDLLADISEITVILSPQAVKAGVIEITVTRPDDRSLISEQENARIYAQLKGQAAKEAEEHSIKLGLLPQEIIPVDLLVEETLIDGYSVSHLTGYPGKTVEIKAISAIAPAYYLNDLRSIFDGDKYSNKTIRISHFGAAIRPLINEKHFNGLIIGVQERWTRLFSVARGVITRIDDINFGDRHISRVLEKQLGLSEKEAVRLKENYIDGKLSEAIRASIHRIFTEAVNELFDQIIKAVPFSINSSKQQLSTINKLTPEKIYLFGRGVKLPEFKSVIESNWQNVSASAPEIIIISPKIIIGWLVDTGSRTVYKDLTGRVSSPDDIAVLSACFYGKS